MKNRRVIITAILCVMMLIMTACSGSKPYKEEASGSSGRTQKEEAAESSKPTKAREDDTETAGATEIEEEKDEREEPVPETEESTEEVADSSAADPSAPLIPFKAAVFETNEMMIEIWEEAAKLLKSQGIDLQIVKKETGVPISESLINGEADICIGGMLGKNVLQPAEPAANEDKTCPVGYAYGYPANMYSKNVESLDELKDGAEIRYPAHGCHQALLMLQEAGLITLNKDMPYFRTESVEEADELAAKYIESYEKDITLKSYFTGPAGSEISMYLDGLDAFIMEFQDVQREQGTGNFWQVKTIYEDPLVDYDYMQTLIVRADDVKDPDKLSVIEKVVKAFQSDGTRKCFEKRTTNIAPAGWDVDLISQYR